ncbi:MAG: flagellar motor stator protein MotA, partial [Syntrophorhabdaceae bacterium]|nr:flagellar motor stator protein MotA [Syntrophorhabdaceae bacterium]
FMFVIIGFIVVIGSVIGGYVSHHGPLLVLWQPSEFIIIGGAALGALIVSAPTSLLKKIISKVLGSLKGNKIDKKTYLELLKLLYELFMIIRKDGLIALESHVERPKESPIFSKYPAFLNDHHVLFFITDTLRLVVMGGVSPHEIESIMDADIDLHHREGSKPGAILQKIGDSLPGLGIVAAVLGIIITMQAISGPPEIIGQKVAAALVGTFLGVLMSYGFVQPLATNLEISTESESTLYEVIKSGIICAAKGLNPIVAVEFARRSISSDFRPTFQEMEEYVKGAK